MMNGNEQERRVREVAYWLWEEAGSPEGRDDEFWGKALQIDTAKSKVEKSPSDELAASLLPDLPHSI